jgi:hypothetical protein
MADFNRIRYRHHDADVFLYAFDLIEHHGDDLRHDPLQVRKATLASVIARAAPDLSSQQSICLGLPHNALDAPQLSHQHRRMIGRGHASAGRDLKQLALDLAQSPPLHLIVVAHRVG